MMGNDPSGTSPDKKPAGAKPRHSRQRAIAVDPVAANLRRAYAETLAEPLPPAIAALLRQLD